VVTVITPLSLVVVEMEAARVAKAAAAALPIVEYAQRIRVANPIIRWVATKQAQGTIPRIVRNVSALWKIIGSAVIVGAPAGTPFAPWSLRTNATITANAPAGPYVATESVSPWRPAPTVRVTAAVRRVRLAKAVVAKPVVPHIARGTTNVAPTAVAASADIALGGNVRATTCTTARVKFVKTTNSKSG